MKKLPKIYEVPEKLFWLFVYAPIIAISWRFLNQDLTNWDIGGHYLAAKQFRDSIWPYFSGWNLNNLSGFPQGYFYPSLLHWLAGGLGKLFDLTLVFKFLINLSILIFPLSIQFLAQSLNFSRFQRQITVLWATALIFIPKGMMGGDLLGTFTIGLVSQQFAIPILFFYLGFLAQTLNEKPRAWIWAGYLGGLLLLAHAFMFIAGMIGAISLIAFTWQKNKKLYPFRNLFLHGLILLAVSSIWLIPYLRFHSLQTGRPIFLFASHFFSSVNRWGEISMYLFGGISLYSIYKLNREKIELGKPLLYISGFFILFFLIFKLGEVSQTFQFIGDLPLHPYRLINIFYLFLCFVIGLGIAELKQKKWIAGCSIIFLIFASFPNLEVVNPKENSSLALKVQFPASDRILTNLSQNGPFYERSPHLLADKLGNEGLYLMNGLFVESSLSSPAVQSIMASLFNFPFRWGVKMLPVNPWLIDQQIHWSGITTIISDEPIVKDLLGKFRFIDQVTVIGNARVNELAMNQNYFVYRFMNPIAEYLESKPKLFNSTDETSWRMMIDRWWASDSEIQTTWIQSEEKLNQWNEDKSGELNVKFINSEKIELNSSSNTNRWILLKETYFPNWKAFENGIEIPVYRASPHLMAVFAKGKIEFRFLRSNLEWISIFITLLAAMMLIGIFLMQVKRKWMK